jgi:hypothetical protein
MGLDSYIKYETEDPEIAYWRKNYIINNYMWDLYLAKHIIGDGDFAVPNDWDNEYDFKVILSYEDLENFEATVNGFLFAKPDDLSDEDWNDKREYWNEYYKADTLKYIADAKKAICDGLVVYYLAN